MGIGLENVSQRIVVVQVVDIGIGLEKVAGGRSCQGWVVGGFVVILGEKVVGHGGMEGGGRR